MLYDAGIGTELVLKHFILFLMHFIIFDNYHLIMRLLESLKHISFLNSYSPFLNFYSNLIDKIRKLFICVLNHSRGLCWWYEEEKEGRNKNYLIFCCFVYNKYLLTSEYLLGLDVKIFLSIV